MVIFADYTQHVVQKQNPTPSTRQEENYPDYWGQRKSWRKTKFYANCQRFQHTQNNNWKNSQGQGHFQVKTDFRNTKSNCEKVRPFKHENVDEALHMWSRNLNKMPESIFPASKLKQPSWRRSLENSLNRQIAGWFKSRHNLKFKKEQGEKQHNDSEAESLFREGQLKEILQDYEPAHHRV